MIRNRTTMPHAAWGQGCDAWALLSNADLSVKHERMPAGTHEVRHFHAHAQQFFFVLSGALTLEKAGQSHVLAQHDGLAVEPGVPHQAINAGPDVVEFLVISTPPTAQDRIETR